MSTRLHFGDESKLRMPNTFGKLDIQALRDSQAGAHTTAPVAGEQYRDVKLSAITGESPLQLRAPFDPEHDDEDRALLDSLEGDGQRVPVLLAETESAQGRTYAPLDGHRRIAALRCLSRESVKAVILRTGSVEYDLVTLTANVRKNLAPLEQARAVSRLRERHQLTVEAIARRAGIARQHVHRLLALLETDPAVQAAVEARRLSANAARALGQAPREQQPQLAEVASACGLTEAQAERLVEHVHATGAAPDDAARSLGLVPAEAPVRDADSPESTPPARARRGRRRRKALEAVTPEEAQSLLARECPELDARAAKLLARLAVQHQATVQAVRVAGLLALSGQSAGEAVETGRLASHVPVVRRILALAQLCAEVGSLIAGGQNDPACAPLLAAVVGRLTTLQRASARAERK